jgi:hypothetical protein
VKIPHGTTFNDDIVKNELGIGRLHWESFTAMCDTLATIKLDTAKAQQVLDTVWKVEREKLLLEPNSDTVHVSNVIDLFSGRGIGADVRGATGWGLVNAVTQYVDQEKRARNQGNRLDSAWFGEGFNLKQRAVDETLKLAA